MEPEIFQALQSIIKTLPEKPGIYQYFNKNNEIIYVGKARNLKKRVSSYFVKQHAYPKTAILVGKIADIKTISVATENDALFLENVLIKQHRPRYNSMMKDDKTYPWICINNEPFPRIFPTRNIVRNGSEYFGPYPSLRSVNTLFELIRSIYPLRSCRFPLNPEKIKSKKYEVCLEYHIGNCAAPCEGKQTHDDYMAMIRHIREIIKGNIKEVLQLLRDEMLRYAESLEFEKAQTVKLKYDQLLQYQSKSVVVSPDITNLDVFSISVSPTNAYVNFLGIVNGAIVKSRMLELKKRLDETPENLLALSIVELRQQGQSTAHEIIVPFIPDAELNGVFYTVPQRGDKYKLLQLSERNVRLHRIGQEKLQKITDPEMHTTRLMHTMQADLRMTVPPTHIECFDNSNIQGAFPVSSMVVFRNGKPSKKEYRHFNIKTVEGINDFASMEEVIYRRYYRLLEEKQELPQLIVIDGGKGQLSFALASLEKLGLKGKITIISIAKRLEEIYFPGDSLPLFIDKTSQTLKIIQQMRNEAHRFGITHHRNRRSKNALVSEMNAIPGIGKKTIETLLKEYGSLAQIKKTAEEGLAKVVGKYKAKILVDSFS